MSVPRHPTPQVPLARVALLAGEVFGHHSSETALTASFLSAQMRSTLALAVVVCAMIAAYLAV